MPRKPRGAKHPIQTYSPAKTVPWYDPVMQEQIFYDILREVVQGKTLTSVIEKGKKRGKPWPSVATFLYWTDHDEIWKQEYTRALAVRSEVQAENMFDIAANEPDVNRARVMLDYGK